MVRITPFDASLVIYIKGKGLPRQAEVARGVPGRLRPRIFLTFRHYKGGWSSAKRTGRLYPRRNPWYSLSEAESTTGHMVLSGVPRKKKSPLTPPGFFFWIDPGTVRLVQQRLNHYAIPGYLASNMRNKCVLNFIRKILVLLFRNLTGKNETMVSEFTNTKFQQNEILKHRCVSVEHKEGREYLNSLFIDKLRCP